MKAKNPIKVNFMIMSRNIVRDVMKQNWILEVCIY
jgi:hypothetical protein